MNELAERAAAIAAWHAREAANLRRHHSTMGSMPELAEMHEETVEILTLLISEKFPSEKEG